MPDTPVPFDAMVRLPSGRLASFTAAELIVFLLRRKALDAETRKQVQLEGPKAGGLLAILLPLRDVRFAEVDALVGRHGWIAAAEDALDPADKGFPMLETLLATSEMDGPRGKSLMGLRGGKIEFALPHDQLWPAERTGFAVILPVH